MQTLFLLRGAPASGKSTFIKENGLEPYTLCADKIRTQVSSPILNLDGKFCISQANDKYVWETLFQMLKRRMQDGCLTFIDATHYKSSLINQYKKLVEKYRYRVYIIDFTDVPYEELIKRNNEREQYKRVPEEVIKKMTTCFTDDKEIRKWCKVIKPSEFKETIMAKPLAINEYNKLAFIGDIHGCYTALSNYFNKYPFDEKTLYIFLGDYTDRGIENKEVIQWLLENHEKKNVWLLKSNHTIHLEHFANEEYDLIRSREFRNNTMKQLESFDKKDLRRICRKFIQLAYITFNNKTFLATHGGICIDDLRNLQYVPTKQFMFGVGKYEDSETVDKKFSESDLGEVYSIHGHRNIYKVPMHNTKYTYNLDSAIEYGEPLKVLHFEKNEFTEIQIENPVFVKKEVVSNKLLDITSENELVNKLSQDKDIIKKDLGDGYYSFNFSRDVFYKKKWNELTEVARGLFIHLPDGKIVARSYKKFFNLNENKDTSLEAILSKVQYPVYSYLKYNGYLGLLSYDFINDDFFIATKSTNQGDYKLWFKEILVKNNYLTDSLKYFLKEHNYTFIFEVIDPIRDPHIIKNEGQKIILLDIIKNDFKFEKLDYSSLVAYGSMFNFIVKYQVDMFMFKDELINFINTLYKDPFLWNEEGVVFEDDNGYMFKLKTDYYKFWKEMRTIKDSMAKGHTIKKIYKDDKWIAFYKFLESLPKEELSKDIITLRDKFLNQ